MSDNRSFFGGPDANAMDLGFGPDPAPEQEQPTEQGIWLTNEQFRMLTEQRREQDYAAALTGQPTPELPDIDLSQLPDPRVDFDAFRTSLAQGLTTARDQFAYNAQQQVNQAIGARDLVDNAWSLMQQRYPDLIGQEAIVREARDREIEGLQQRGLDWMAALNQNMEGAVDAVAQRAMTTLQRARGFEAESEPDNSRSDMISGGNPRPGPARQRREDPVLFTDELKKIQRDMGIY